eukprot:6704318-Pyramimonas_sp.AAC.1
MGARPVGASQVAQCSPLGVRSCTQLPRWRPWPRGPSRSRRPPAAAQKLSADLEQLVLQRMKGAEHVVT